METTVDENRNNGPPRLVRRDGYPFDEERVSETEDELARRILEDIVTPIYGNNEDDDNPRSRQRRRTSRSSRRNRRSPSSTPTGSDNEGAGPSATNRQHTELEAMLAIMRETNEVSGGILDRMDAHQQFLEQKRAREEELHSERMALLRQEADLSERILRFLEDSRNTNRQNANQDE